MWRRCRPRIRLSRSKRAAASRLCLLALLALLPACASLRFSGNAVLRIDCDVASASVFINDAYVGIAREWAVDGRMVRPGFLRIELRHPERFTHYQDVTLTKGDAVRLQVTLHPLLDQI